MKHAVLVSALTGVLTATSLAAQAADLPSRAPYSPPPAVVVPVYNWTGIYLGVNGGYAWGRQDPLSLITTRYDQVNTDIDGWTVGGTFGAQIQSGHVVLGVEGDINWANIKGYCYGRSHELRCSGRIYRYGCDRGHHRQHRAGARRLRDAELADVRHRWCCRGHRQDQCQRYRSGVRDCRQALPCSGDATRVGIAAGGGLEYGFTQNWSAKLEYIWIGAALNDASSQHRSRRHQLSLWRKLRRRRRGRIATPFRALATTPTATARSRRRSHRKRPAAGRARRSTRRVRPPAAAPVRRSAA